MDTNAIGAAATVSPPVVRVNATPAGVAATTPAAPATPDATSPNAGTASSVGPPSAAALQAAVDKANTVLQTKTSNELQFSIEKGTGIAVVKMVNQDTGKTVLQFPSETMLQIARSIDQVTGAIIRESA